MHACVCVSIVELRHAAQNEGPSQEQSPSLKPTDDGQEVVQLWLEKAVRRVSGQDGIFLFPDGRLLGTNIWTCIEQHADDG